MLRFGVGKLHIFHSIAQYGHAMFVDISHVLQWSVCICNKVYILSIVSWAHWLCHHMSLPQEDLAFLPMFSDI